MIEIANRGQDIAHTNYWESEHAAAGFLYLSANAGALRLLVPKAAADLLAEMRTGKRVVIEPSRADLRCLDLVFEDDTDCPFVVTLDRRQIDRALSPGGGIAFGVWTESGKQLSLTATVAAV